MNISDDVIISFICNILYSYYCHTELIIITVTVFVYKGKKVPYMV